MKNKTPSGDIALAVAAELVVVVAIFIGAIVFVQGGPVVSALLERLAP